VSFPFPTLVCDVGGTNARFGLKEGSEAPMVHVASLKTHDFPGLADAIAAAVDSAGIRPRSVIACGAGPVIDRRLKLTNAPWVIDGPQVAQRLGIEQGLLLNDFEAQALSLPTIPEDWVRHIGPSMSQPGGTRVILGPGTGLGIGALLDTGGHYIPISSEACHVDFGPSNAEEAAFWPHLERVHGRVTTESVMSGPGLVRLHKARLAVAGHPIDAIDAGAIVDAAHADGSGEEAQTIAAFCRLIGRFAGDMAITFFATGGVTLAGGVLPRFVDLIDPAAFRAAFEDKAPVAALARSIGTRLVIQQDAVLVGMAAVAAEPSRYFIDYGSRFWR
jgi:glucokinase